jgi:hypothetical protein
MKIMKLMAKIMKRNLSAIININGNNGINMAIMKSSRRNGNAGLQPQPASCGSHQL